MHQHWAAKFGDFNGTITHVCGTQCAKLRLKAQHRIAFMDFLETLQSEGRNNRPVVELVVSSETGLLTNIQYFCEVFEQLSTADWRFQFFDNRMAEFTRIDVYAIIEHFHNRPTTLDGDTSSFVATIKIANDTREMLSGPKPNLGLRRRNRGEAPDRPELTGRERARARARRIQVRECPLCPRQYLTDEEFHRHTSIHGPATITPMLRNIDHDPDSKPQRCALHTFESTLIRAWRSLGCGLQTGSSGTFENHPPKCRNNPEKKAGLDLFETWVTDADEMTRQGFECRICFSSISKEHIARAHIRQEHHLDADGHYLWHQNGYRARVWLQVRETLLFGYPLSSLARLATGNGIALS